MKTIRIVSNGKISLKDASEEIKEFIFEVFENSGYKVESKKVVLEVTWGSLSRISFTFLKKSLLIIVSSKKIETTDYIVNVLIEKIDDMDNIQMSIKNNKNPKIDFESVLDIPKFIEELYELKEKKMLTEKEFENKKKYLLDKI